MVYLPCFYCKGLQALPFRLAKRNAWLFVLRMRAWPRSTTGGLGDFHAFGSRGPLKHTRQDCAQSLSNLLVVILKALKGKVAKFEREIISSDEARQPDSKIPRHLQVEKQKRGAATAEPRLIDADQPLGFTIELHSSNCFLLSVTTVLPFGVLVPLRQLYRYLHMVCCPEDLGLSISRSVGISFYQFSGAGMTLASQNPAADV